MHMQTCGNTGYCQMSLSNCIDWPMQLSPPSGFYNHKWSVAWIFWNFQQNWTKRIFRVPETSGSLLNQIFREPDKMQTFFGFPKNQVQNWTRFFGNPKNLVHSFLLKTPKSPKTKSVWWWKTWGGCNSAVRRCNYSAKVGENWASVRRNCATIRRK